MSKSQDDINEEKGFRTSTIMSCDEHDIRNVYIRFYFDVYIRFYFDTVAVLFA